MKYKKCHGFEEPSGPRAPTTLRHRMICAAVDHLDVLIGTEVFRAQTDPVVVLLAPSELALYMNVLIEGTPFENAPLTEPPMAWLIVDRSWFISFLMVLDERGVPRSPECAALLRQGVPASVVAVAALAEGYTSLAVMARPRQVQS